MHDIIPDIEIITMSSEGYVYAISISFPSAIENFTKDLSLAFILAIVGLLNSLAIQQVLGHSFSDGIIPCDFQVVLELIYVKVPPLILGVLEGVIHIHWVQELYN
jgi:hypothetical protein